MLRASTLGSAALFASVALGLVGSGCGGGSDITGSQCDLVGCGYSERVCEFYTPPNDAYRLTYSKAAGSGDVAVLIIDLVDLANPGDVALTGDDFVSRVELYRTSPDEQWPEVADGTLTISRGGFEAGQRLKGKAGFSFDNGYFASFKFSCPLDAAL